MALDDLDDVLRGAEAIDFGGGLFASCAGSCTAVGGFFFFHDDCFYWFGKIYVEVIVIFAPCLTRKGRRPLVLEGLPPEGNQRVTSIVILSFQILKVSLVRII